MWTALVTGGCSGIGRAISMALADDGCRVVATALTSAEIEAAAFEGRDVMPVEMDVTEPASIEAVVDALPRLDVLVNCAGTIAREGREHDPEVFVRVVDVNLNGTMRVSEACRSRLAASASGCVLNVASMLSFFGSGRVPAYSASKGGIVQLTKSLAIAWAVDGVRVNAIAPGWIETAMTGPLRDDSEFVENIVARTPLGRWGTPADVAPVATFLCSPAAAFVTGVVLPVDGGYAIA